MQTSAPLITIIIPTFNRAHLIGETLDSVRLQSQSDWECIIVDDGSTDETSETVLQYIKSDTRFKFFARPTDRPKGANACRNYGFEKSGGHYINWFDSDDIMHVDFLREKVACMDDHTDAVVSKSCHFRGTKENIVSYEKRTTLAVGLFEDFATLKVSWYLPDILWSKKYLADKMLFDEHLLAGQDREFHLRMLLNDPRLTLCDKYLTYCRIHQDNITSTINNIRNTSLKISHMRGMIRLIGLMTDQNKLSVRLRKHYLKTMIKYLPYTIGNRSDEKALSGLILKLSAFDTSSVYDLARYSIARLTYKHLNRGYFLIK